MRSIASVFLLACAATMLPAGTATAQNASLRLGSDGEAGGKGDWIDVQSWKWGETVPTMPGQPPAHELREIADVGSLTIVARVDSASCKLGTRYGGARLRTGGYLDYVLEDVMVSCCATGGSSGGEPPLESMSLNYTKVVKEYKAQDEKSPKTAPKKKSD